MLPSIGPCHLPIALHPSTQSWRDRQVARAEDRKSTRLNSSHDQISYSVFCLKKKRTKRVLMRMGESPCVLALAFKDVTYSVRSRIVLGDRHVLPLSTTSAEFRQATAVPWHAFFDRSSAPAVLHTAWLLCAHSNARAGGTANPFCKSPYACYA